MPTPQELQQQQQQRAQAVYDEEHKFYEESLKQYKERMKGKITPSQKENDMARLGMIVVKKREDGSGPPPVWSMARAMVR